MFIAPPANETKRPMKEKKGTSWKTGCRAYTGTPLAEFGEYVLLTNFRQLRRMVRHAARRFGKGRRSTDGPT